MHIQLQGKWFLTDGKQMWWVLWYPYQSALREFPGQRGEEIVRFLQRPKLIHEQINNLTTPISVKENEIVVIKLPTKQLQAQIAYLVNLKKYLMEKQY